MRTCPVRVPAWAEPVLVQIPDPPKPKTALRHVATVAHFPGHAGEALLTCTCRGLRAVVEVDDAEYRAFLLAEHRDSSGVDHLLVEDARTGVLYADTSLAQPAVSLVLTVAGDTDLISHPATGDPR